MWLLLTVHTVRTFLYHSQTDGLVEKFIWTVKGMLRKFVPGEIQKWDVLLLYLLFMF